MSRRSLLAVSLLSISLAAACAERPAGPAAVVIPPQPAASSARAPEVAGVLRGHVFGADGKPLAAAHARLIDGAGAAIEEVPAEADGSFALPIGKLHGVGEISFSGVDHRVERILVAEEDRVGVDVRLGTYRAPERIDKLSLQVMNEPGGPREMTRQPDGTFAIDLSLRDGAHSYELAGLNTEGHLVNGTMGKGFRYDGDGDYETLFEVTDGKARIVYDPAKRPPPNRAATVAFSDPSSTSAALTRLAIDVAAAKRARDEKASPSGLEEGRAALSTRIDALANAAKKPVVKTSAAIAKFALPAETWSATDAAAAKRLVAEIAPTDPLWGLWDALPNVLAAAGRSPEIDAYAAAFVEQSPSTKAVGEVLLAELERHGDDPEKRRPIVAALRGPRFAKNPVMRLRAEVADPDRVTAPGKKLPSFEVAALVGDKLDPKRTVTPKSLEGRVFVVDLWATWCKPCVAELPAMDAIFQKYGTGAGAKRFGMLSISLDNTPEAVVAFRKDKGHTMPWLHGYAGMKNGRNPLTGGNISIPLYVLVDEKGTILASSPELTISNLPAQLDKALK